VVAAFLLTLAMLPAAAQAGTFALNGVISRFSSWTFTGDGSETDEVTVTMIAGFPPLTSNQIQIEVSNDDTITIDPGPFCAPGTLCGCTGNNTPTVRCPANDS